MGLRFGEEACLLKNAAKVNPAKISHLNGDQACQGPQPRPNARHGGGGNTLHQDDGNQAQQHPDAEDRPCHEPSQKMNDDQKGQSGAARINGDGLSLIMNG